MFVSGFRRCCTYLLSLLLITLLIPLNYMWVRFLRGDYLSDSFASKERERVMEGESNLSRAKTLPSAASIFVLHQTAYWQSTDWLHSEKCWINFRAELGNGVHVVCLLPTGNSAAVVMRMTLCAGNSGRGEEIWVAGWGVSCTLWSASGVRHHEYVPAHPYQVRQTGRLH